MGGRIHPISKVHTPSTSRMSALPTALVSNAVMMDAVVYVVHVLNTRTAAPMGNVSGVSRIVMASNVALTDAVEPAEAVTQGLGVRLQASAQRLHRVSANAVGLRRAAIVM